MDAIRRPQFAGVDGTTRTRPVDGVAIASRTEALGFTNSASVSSDCDRRNSTDVTRNEKRRWEERGRRETYRSPAEPAPVVRDAVDDLPSGRTLDVATGTGGNAIFLADRGWEVDAVDISRSMLDRARTLAAERSVSVNWILADVDDYCLREATYDVVTISYFDARHRLPAVKRALAPGGVLCYEHHLTTGEDVAGPSARYRFEPGELRAACSDLAIERYEEDRAEKRVTLVARTEPT